MRNLTATLCLTIAVLLGSVGVSWSADLQTGEDVWYCVGARSYVDARRIDEPKNRAWGLNQKPDRFIIKFLRNGSQISVTSHGNKNDPRKFQCDTHVYVLNDIKQSRVACKSAVTQSVEQWQFDLDDGYFYHIFGEADYANLYSGNCSKFK